MSRLWKVKAYYLLCEDPNEEWSPEIAAVIRRRNIIKIKDCYVSFNLETVSRSCIAYFGKTRLSEDEFLEACVCWRENDKTPRWWKAFVVQGALWFAAQAYDHELRSE